MLHKSKWVPLKDSNHPHTKMHYDIIKDYGRTYAVTHYGDAGEWHANAGRVGSGGLISQCGE